MSIRSSFPIPRGRSGYTGSDYLWHGALVYDGVVYDHIHFRARGGVWRYAMGKNMWKFDFNRGHDFEARDDYGDKYERRLEQAESRAPSFSKETSGTAASRGCSNRSASSCSTWPGSTASNTNYVHFRIVESANENGAEPIQRRFSGPVPGRRAARRQLPGRARPAGRQPLQDGERHGRRRHRRRVEQPGRLPSKWPTRPT